VIAGARLGFLEAQVQSPLAFEVASLRPHAVSRGMRKPWMPTFQCAPEVHCGLIGNRFREVSVSLADLIVDAYKVRNYQIIGLPSWGDSGQVYDLEAKVADDIKPTVDEARLMLQSFLADRFQLRIRHETRDLPVYALVTTNKGIKLIANQPPCGIRTNERVATVKQNNGAGTAPDSAPLYHYPWAFYAQQLSTKTDRPVIDETGLDGVDYCTTEGQSPTLAIMVETSEGASIFTAVEDKWGMRLDVDSGARRTGFRGERENDSGVKTNRIPG
jgi:uncharacterized protein (TIGR03435 family)